MDDSLRIYRRSRFLEEAQQLYDDLVNAGVPARIRNNSTQIDTTFTGGPVVEYHVMVPFDRFSEADDALARMAAGPAELMLSDHHLRALTDAELLEVVEHPDEWSALDVEVVRLLLKERGVEVSEQQVRMHFQERMKELAQPGSTPWAWIILGYLLPWKWIVLGPSLGPIWSGSGMLIGWSLFAVRKTLPNGERMPLYTDAVRFHGRIMFGPGLVILALSVVLFFREAA